MSPTLFERFRGEGGFSLSELLVVITVLGIVAAGTMTVVVTTSRANVYSRELRTVMDDGRISLDRIRKELRGGRRMLAGSTAHHLYWWNDENQDGLQQLSERIHYCVAELVPNDTRTCETSAMTTAATGKKWQLIRWTDDEAQADARSIARTLTRTAVFSGFASPVTATDVVTTTFWLDYRSTTGPDEIQLAADVRLRNVA